MQDASGQVRGGTDTSLRALLPERVRDTIRAEIGRARWPQRLPSERWLAQEFQVSRPTLHLALHALAKEGLLRAERGKGWHVLRPATGRIQLPARAPEVLLVRYAKISPSPTSLLELTDLLHPKLHRLGYGLRLVDASAHGSAGLCKTLAQIDVEYRPSFYLLSSVPAEAHRWYAARETPTIVLGSRAPGIGLPAIEFDPDVTISHAVDYLRRRGHRRLALYNLPPVTVGMVRLSDAFRRCCAQRSKGEIQGTIITTPSRPEALEKATRRLFAQPTPPTAVFVTHLDFVIGLYTIIGELGLRVPRDVSILSTCYWPILDFLRPLPTCYQFSWENMASRIVRIIRNYVRLGVWPDKFWNLLPTLREGGSVAPIAPS